MRVEINGVLFIPAPEQPKQSAMTEHERGILLSQIDKSGLCYAMVDYSDYQHGRSCVSDPRFHQLRNAFVKAHGELREYLDSQGCMP